MQYLCREFLHLVLVIIEFRPDHQILLILFPVDKRSIALFINHDERLKAINANPIPLSLFKVNDIPNLLSQHFIQQKLLSLYLYILL